MFFAILNFTLSGAIFVIGILTLKKVSSPNEVVFASLPLLYFYFLERRIAFLQEIREKENGLNQKLSQELNHLEGFYPRLRKTFTKNHRSLS